VSVTPPLGPGRPAGDQTCGRLTRGGHCGDAAVEHIAWTSDMENGLVCPTHRDEARTRWAYYDHHPIGGLCTNDGTMWITSWNDPPGYCAEPVADGWSYYEVYETAEVAR
jgi:hypothetical protein